MRFAIVQDPCDDWMVYDLLYDLPAEIAGNLPVGLTREEAERLARQANWRWPERSRARLDFTIPSATQAQARPPAE